MKKWADYAITAVKFVDGNKSKYVDSVKLHKGDPNLNIGSKYRDGQIISLWLLGTTFITAKWDYANKRWIPGAEVVVIYENKIAYIHSHIDAASADKLENLIDLDKF